MSFQFTVQTLFEITLFMYVFAEESTETNTNVRTYIMRGYVTTHSEPFLFPLNLYY